MKMDVFKTAKKSTHIWATFVRNFITKNFQNSPNLVTLHLNVYYVYVEPPHFSSFTYGLIAVNRTSCSDLPLPNEILLNMFAWQLPTTRMHATSINEGDM